MRWLLLSDKFFWLIILVSLILRLTLAFLPGLTFDMDYWVNWSERLQRVGFDHFYTSTERTDYLPGYLYVLYLLGLIKDFFHLSTNTYLYILKLPGIFSELLLASVVYSVLLKLRGFKIARLSLLFICFNPALIFNSAVWGQVDSILTLFLFLTIMTLNMNRVFLSGILWGISLLMKPQALSILPLVFLNVVYNFSILRFIKTFLTPSLILVIFSLPFFGSNVVTGLLSHLQNTANEYPYNSLSAYNLWGIIGYWINDNNQLFGITYYHWGIFFYFTFWVIVLFVSLRKSSNLYTLATLSTLSFYFLPTRIHERYLYPALIFLIFCSFMLKRRILIILTVILSFLHFINLLYVYIQYNGHLLTFIQYLNPLYQFLGKNITLLSFISTMLFAIIAITLLTTNYAKRNS